MKTVNSTISNNTTNHSLHKLVDEVIRDLSMVPFTGKSRIVNKVSPDLFIRMKDENILSSIISGLLYALLSNATEGNIEVSARELFGNTMKIFMRDNNCYNTYAVACALQKILPMAERIGGFLNIMNQRQKITTIEFSFPLEREDKLATDFEQ